MSNELELAAGASVGGFVRSAPSKHAAPPGTPCANCATPLQGPWCHVCGQSAEDFHRSIFRLMAEVVEGLLHADGRLWRTLPDLMLRPGKLTRDYLEGHRAPQIPPLRLFLVVLLTIFIVGGVAGKTKPVHINTSSRTESGGKVVTTGYNSRSLDQLTPAERAKIQQGLGKVEVHLGGDKADQTATNWLQSRLERTLADPERFYLILEQWSERFAILMLPVSALLLSLLYLFQRRFFMFDHTIFSLHSLSAVGILIILAMALSALIGSWGYVALLPAPFHLYGHMRRVYGSSVLGVLTRMGLLFLGSTLAAGILITGLIAVGLNGMGD